MKKLLFTALLASGLMMASCSSNEEPAANGQAQTAVISISLPDAFMPVDSRAGGHTDYINSGKGSITNQPDANVNFYVALFYGNNPTPIFSKVKGCDAATHSVTFSPTLVMGETYRLVAWAEYADQVATEADTDFDFTNIPVNQSLNDEANDAFFFSGDVAAAQTLSATLKRPFGKLRLIAEDYNTLSPLGKSVKSVKVTYKSARSTTFNAVTGEFADATVTTTEFSGDINTYSEETGNSKTLFADYIAVGPNGASMFPFDVVVTYNDNTTFSRSFTDDIPVKRNCLTTLTGDFFSVSATLDLTIDEAFDNEDVIPYTFVSASEFADAGLNDATANYLIQGTPNPDGSVQKITLTDVKNVVAKGVTLADVEISTPKAINLTANDITLRNVTLAGDQPKANGNAMMSFNNAETVTLKNVNMTKTNGYNTIEIGLGNTTTLPKEINIDGLVIPDGSSISNNAILIFGTQDNATINISNCYFSKVSNCLRLSNKTNATGVKVNISNTTCAAWDTDPNWAGFLILENYTDKTAEEAETNNRFGPDKLEITFDNVYGPGNTKIAFDNPAKGAPGPSKENQAYYICIDNPSPNLLNWDSTKYPTFIFK